MLLYTIGHSNRPLADFLALLAENSIQHIADVRRFPGSRRHRQFGRDALAAALQGFVPFFSSGKGTDPLPDSGAAEDEAAALHSGKKGTHPLPPRIIGYTHFPALGGRRKPLLRTPPSAWRVAAFAAYADYMLTDDFARAFVELESLAKGQVFDIIGPSNTKPHELPDFAFVTNGQVTYPGPPRPLFDN